MNVFSLSFIDCITCGLGAVILLFVIVNARSAVYRNEVTKDLRGEVERWGKEVPSAVKCLSRSIDSGLTFMSFPEDEWISLRTTNIIERLNKEFKRRTKSMEIVAGEKACYTLLAFISLKMEMHWRSNPIGKVRHNLPFFQNLIVDNFTQNS